MSKFHPDHLYQWVYSFMETHRLFPPSKRAVVAFSGGEDSVLLWHILEQIAKMAPDKLNELVAVHVDHGLRENSALQAQQLKKNYPFLKVMTITERSPARDIEAWSRKHRYHLLKDQLGKGDVLYMGHHIDDSIEWYLRQLFAGSSSHAQMGIPLINGAIRRPLHCLSKKQISKFVKYFELFHIYDESNEDLRFQRNFIRHKVLSEVYQEFPKAQAHFVERANAWAKQGKSDYPIFRYGKYLTVIYCPLGLRWVNAKGEIKRELERLCLENRGEFRQSTDRLIKSLDSQHGAKGPFSFSGGVKVYAYAGMIILTNPLGLADIRQWDREVSLDTTQIPVRLQRLKKLSYEKLQGVLPFVFYKSHDFKFMGSKAMKGMKEDSLFPLILERMKREGYEMRPMSFVQRALSKKRKDALPVLFIKFDP